MIRAIGLSRYYGPFTAIENVSFDVPPATVCAFLGPNGAGKTTTIRILAGSLAASSGSAAIGGMDVRAERRVVARTIGYLPENGPLYPEMTPAAFLRHVAAMRGLGGNDRRDALERVASDCRLQGVWQKAIHKLSKGYRQRVGLAQALLHDPQVLILDEPTSGLDPNQIGVVRDLLRSLAQTKTILLSTHILQEVQAMADRVVLLSEGRVRFDDTLAAFTADDRAEERFRELTGGVAL